MSGAQLIKRAQLAFLAIALCAFCACDIKTAVQNKTREMLGTVLGTEPSPGTGAQQPGQTAQTGLQGGAPASDTAASSQGEASNRRPIATLPPGSGYQERLENEWLNAPNEGYVWTITINDTDTIDVMGLASATYNVRLSASHIGPDMYGTYFGEFAFDYSADLGGLSALMTMQGGSVDYDADGWFENDVFYFKINPYDPEEEEMLEAIARISGGGEELTDEEREIANAYLGMFIDMDKEADFEKAGPPAGMWWGLDIPMTDGDMSAYFGMNGIMGGMVDGYSEVDETGKNVEADVRVAFGLYANGSLVYKYDERYTETDTIDNPLPHTIKVYDDKNVVMTVYGSDGLVATKLYGTIDMVPVGETTVVGR